MKFLDPPWDPLSLSLTPLPCQKAQVLKVSAGSQISQLEFITQLSPPHLSAPSPSHLHPLELLSPLDPPWQEPSHSFSVDQLRSCLIRVWTTAAMLFQRAPWHTIAAAGEAAVLSRGCCSAARCEQKAAAAKAARQVSPKLPKKKTNRKKAEKNTWQPLKCFFLWTLCGKGMLPRRNTKAISKVHCDAVGTGTDQRHKMSKVSCWRAKNVQSRCETCFFNKSA